MGTRRWSGRRRAAERREHDDPGRSGRHGLRVPPAERREPHLADAARHDVHRPPHGVPASHFGNSWWTIDHFIKPTDTTCPAPGAFAPTGVLDGSGLPGGCTRDIVHRFYQEQYQIDGGKQDRYVTGSDAVGLTMGRYSTTSLPIYRYLHSKGAPNYVVADRFFQAAFGGSFLNHQYLIAARAPVDTGGATPTAANSVLDGNGMPTSYPLYTADRRPSRTPSSPRRCSNGAPSTTRPPAATSPSTPSSPRAHRPAAERRSRSSTTRLPQHRRPDERRRRQLELVLGWLGRRRRRARGPALPVPPPALQLLQELRHRRPGRATCRTRRSSWPPRRRARCRRSPSSSPTAPRTSTPATRASRTAATTSSTCSRRSWRGRRPSRRSSSSPTTSSAASGTTSRPPTVDRWGPGTRIPALVLSAGMVKSGVDSTTYDTTSIMATIEHSFGLRPVASRDAGATDLTAAVRMGDPRHQGSSAP